MQNSSDYKLEFTLKQHTPIIHFQADQKGATLRGTELKPKLDRFLIEYAFDNDFNKYKKYLIGYKEGLKVKDFKSKKAFDYKIKIEENNNKKENINANKNPLYFAARKPTNKTNSEWEKEKKWFKDNNTTFKIIIFSTKTELVNEIKKYFSSFVFQTNFGTRQSKGFGSFVVLEDEIKILPSNLYKFTATSKEDAFNKINYFYKMLRSGINEYRKDNNNEQVSIFYGKSLLWLFAKSYSWTWDKKIIKKSFLENDNKYKQQIKKYTTKDDIFMYTGKKQFLMKDMLGLSTEESWYAYRIIIKKEDSNLDAQKKPIISRFKSPIVFKPIQTKEGYDVYYWANDIPAIYLKNKFNISVQGNTVPILLGGSEDFSINKYLKFIYIFSKKKCIGKHIESKYHIDPPGGFSKPKNYRYTNIYTLLNEVFTSIERVPHD